MKILLIIFFGIYLCFTGNSQNNLIKLPKYYKGYGVILSDSAYVPYQIDTLKRIDLSTDDAKSVENIFLNQYNKAMQTDSRVFDFKSVKNVKKYFFKYNRQYLGFRNSKGEKIVLLNLLNFKQCKKARINFIDLETKYMRGFGKFYEENSIEFLLNLDLKTLKLF